MPSMTTDAAPRPVPTRAQLITALVKLSARTLEYVGTAPIDEVLDCDCEMQSLAREGLAIAARAVGQ